MFLRQVDDGTVVIGAPAKVNLFLEVLGKRPDGYHDLHSLFQAVSLFDRLTFVRTPNSNNVRINTTSNVELPLDDNNLIARAYRLLADRFAIEGGLEVSLEKNIPVAAGLAGGSTDAAATLLACSLLFGLGLDFEQLAELGLSIGSDIPFFFSTGQAMVTGRGEKVDNVELPTDYWLVLITPDFGVSTAESYARLDLALTENEAGYSFRGCRAVPELVTSLRASGNDFEEIHLRSYPELGEIKDGLLDRGAQLARLSGSGPTVFGLYIDLPEIEGDAFFGRDSWQVHPVKPVVLPARLP